MSLIADALKTAQRQKQMRESGRPSGSPLLVHLRTPDTAFSWPRAMVMAVSGVVIVVSMFVLVHRMKSRAPLVPLPPVPSPLAGTPLLSEPPTRTSAPRPMQAGTFRVDSMRRGRDPVQGSPSVPERYGASATVSEGTQRRVAAPAPRPEPSVETQGRPVEQSEPPVAVAPSRPPGRLRIAVQEPTTSDAASLFAHALAAHRANDLAVARPLYERVLALAPNDADALNNLGVLMTSLREFDRALDLLRRAASIAPQNAGTWNNIGAALREQGHGIDASAAFRHALGIDPQHQGAKVGLAQQYLASGAAADARRLLEEVLVLNPNLAEAHYTLGQALEVLGDRAGAVREYSAFIRLAPARLAEHVERVRRHVDSLTAQP